MKRAARKHIWDTPTAGNSFTSKVSPGPDNQPQENAEPVSPDALPKPIVEQLRVAEPKQRNRDWERQEQHRPMLFRRIPPGLRDALKEIAENLQVRVDDVARAFLEFGLLCHQKGEVQIQPVLSEGRLTLYPKTNPGAKYASHAGWSENPRLRPVTKPTRKRNRAKPESEKPWKWQVSYRGIPVDVQDRLRTLHREKGVPLGEIAVLLLGHSLKAYRSGRLMLRPQPRTSPSISSYTE